MNRRLTFQCLRPPLEAEGYHCTGKTGENASCPLPVNLMRNWWCSHHLMDRTPSFRLLRTEPTEKVPDFSTASLQAQSGSPESPESPYLLVFLEDLRTTRRQRLDASTSKLIHCPCREGAKRTRLPANSWPWSWKKPADIYTDVKFCAWRCGSMAREQVPPRQWIIFPPFWGIGDAPLKTTRWTRWTVLLTSIFQRNGSREVETHGS